MNDTKQKRSRLPNFTIAEESLLIELAEQHVHIIESKKTDAHTWEEKRQVWNQIDCEFTKRFGLNRGAKNIREKYENLKRKLRRNFQEDGNELHQTQSKRKNEENLLLQHQQQQEYLEKRLAAICASANTSSNDAYIDAQITIEAEQEMDTEYDDTVHSVSLSDPIQEYDAIEDMAPQESDVIEDAKIKKRSTPPQFSEPQENEFSKNVFSCNSPQRKKIDSTYKACSSTNENKYTLTDPDPKKIFYENEELRSAENHRFVTERHKREAERNKLEVEKLRWEIEEAKLRAKILRKKLEQSIMSDDEFIRLETAKSRNISNKSRSHGIDVFSACALPEEIKVEPTFDLADSFSISNEDLILPDTLNVHKRLAECDAGAADPLAILNKRLRQTYNNSDDQQQWAAALRNDISNNTGDRHEVTNLVNAADFSSDNGDDDEYLSNSCTTIEEATEESLGAKEPQTNDESDEHRLLKLLTKHKLQNYFAKLKDMNIDLDCLKHIREVDMKDIFENDIGARIRFRGLVEDWRLLHIHTLKSLLGPQGLLKNLSQVLGPNILKAFNYDGVNGKQSFKDYKAVNAAIFG